MLSYSSSCVTYGSIKYLVETYGINVYRAVINLDGNSGYEAQPAYFDEYIANLVVWTEKLGVYLVIDWHVAENGNPNYYMNGVGLAQGVALNFWKNVASMYRDKSHLLYEIAGEPNQADWSDILRYHNTMITEIRKVDPDTVILVGTGFWCQDIENAFLHPVSNANRYNVMYTLHIYSASHDYLYPLVVQYIDKLPLFVTTISVTDYTEKLKTESVVIEKFLNLFAGSDKTLGNQVVSWISPAYSDLDKLSSMIDVGKCSTMDWDASTCSSIYVTNYLVNENLNNDKYSCLVGRRPTNAPTVGKVRCSDSDYVLYNNNCYKFVATGEVSSAAAERACERDGAFLASINSDQENAFIWNRVKGYESWAVQIGFTDTANEGHFVWANSDPIVYTNWDTGQPDNWFDVANNDYEDCTTMNPNGLWEDHSCQVSIPYVCKMVALNAPKPVPSAVPTRHPTDMASRRPSYSPATVFTARPTPVTTWITLAGVSYGDDKVGTLTSVIQPNLLACQNLCDWACDFYTYNAVTGKCNLKHVDLSSYMGMQFKDQTFYMYGYLRNGGITILSTSITPSIASCRALCAANVNCHYVSFDYRTAGRIACHLNQLSAVGFADVTIGVRTSPLPINYDPITQGRVDIIGNSGVVPIHLNLLPDGNILCTARPEYLRGGPNIDNISPDPLRAKAVPYGEISSIFNPITLEHFPAEIDDNIFCHGSILLEDGRIFTAGGDNAPDMDRAPAQGLTNGLRNFHYYDPATNTWTYERNRLQVTRWYVLQVQLMK